MRRFWRISAWAGGIVLGLGALAALAAWGFFQHFYPSPPVAAYPRPTTAREAQRQDFDYLRKLIALDRSFSPEHRAQALGRIAALEQAPLERAKFHTAVMQIMALADNGHTHGRLMPHDHPGPLTLPLRVTRFTEGFYVLRAAGAARDLLGGRVESIDGMPFARMLQLLETLRGGQENFRRDNAAVYMPVQDFLYGLGIAHAPERSTWTVRMPDGSLVTRTLSAAPLPTGDRLGDETRWLSPEPAKGMGPEWSAYAPAGGALPRSLQKFDTAFLRYRDGCAAYVRLQSIVDTDDQKIAPFLEETEADLRAAKPCAVILDLRYNGGGNYTNTWHLTHALPGLVAPGGRIVVLTDPETFSAAITTTAFTKEAGGAMVRIVGEPVGDRLAFYAEGYGGCLPNSGVCLTYQTGKHDYAHPCTDWNDCFWLNWIYPVRVTTLAPDVAVPLRFADWNAGRDAGYEAAMAVVR